MSQHGRAASIAAAITGAALLLAGCGSSTPGEPTGENDGASSAGPIQIDFEKFLSAVV